MQTQFAASAKVAVTTSPRKPPSGGGAVSGRRAEAENANKSRGGAKKINPEDHHTGGKKASKVPVWKLFATPPSQATKMATSSALSSSFLTSAVVRDSLLFSSLLDRAVDRTPPTCTARDVARYSIHLHLSRRLAEAEKAAVSGGTTSAADDDVAIHKLANELKVPLPSPAVASMCLQSIEGNGDVVEYLQRLFHILAGGGSGGVQLRVPSEAFKFFLLGALRKVFGDVVPDRSKVRHHVPRHDGDGACDTYDPSSAADPDMEAASASVAAAQRFAEAEAAKKDWRALFNGHDILRTVVEVEWRAMRVATGAATAHTKKRSAHAAGVSIGKDLPGVPVIDASGCSFQEFAAKVLPLALLMCTNGFGYVTPLRDTLLELLDAVFIPAAVAASSQKEKWESLLQQQQKAVTSPTSSSPTSKQQQAAADTAAVLSNRDALATCVSKKKNAAGSSTAPVPLHELRLVVSPRAHQPCADDLQSADAEPLFGGPKDKATFNCSKLLATASTDTPHPSRIVTRLETLRKEGNTTGTTGSLPTVVTKPSSGKKSSSRADTKKSTKDNSRTNSAQSSSSNSKRKDPFDKSLSSATAEEEARLRRRRPKVQPKLEGSRKPELSQKHQLVRLFDTYPMKVKSFEMGM